MNCLLTCFKGLGYSLNPLMKSEHKMLNHHEDRRKGRNISATIVEKMGTVSLSGISLTSTITDWADGTGDDINADIDS